MYVKSRTCKSDSKLRIEVKGIEPCPPTVQVLPFALWLCCLHYKWKTVWRIGHRLLVGGHRVNGLRTRRTLWKHTHESRNLTWLCIGKSAHRIGQKCHCLVTSVASLLMTSMTARKEPLDILGLLWLLY